MRMAEQAENRVSNDGRCVMKKITIHWGEDEDTHKDLAPETYEFETQAELKAFFYGVCVAVGYGDFIVIKEGGQCSFCGCDADGHIEQAGEGGAGD